jgi:hypothetical protein
MFEMIMQALGSLVTAIICLAYAAYCMLKGGTHLRGKGWVSREQSPKVFLFSMAIYSILGLLSIISFVYINLN